MSESTTLDQNVMKFRVTIGQRVLAALVFLSFLALSFSIVTTNRSSIAESKSLTSAEAPAASIIFTQRETLVYTVRLAQWIDMQIPRRDVQIARALLAQRLSVINDDGKSVGEEAPSAYLQALYVLDSLVDQSPSGILTPVERTNLLKVINPEIETLIDQARLLVTSYQLAVDNQLTRSAKASRNGDFLTLVLLILFMTLAVSWLGWVARTSIQQYRRSKNLVIAESNRLQILAAELAAANLVVVELESLNASKNEFISNISHELRTPLTSIIGYVDVLATTIDFGGNPQLEEIFEVLDRNATILLSLVQSLLALSLLDSPNKRDTFKKIDLLEVLRDAVFIMDGEIQKKNLTIELNYDENDCYQISGDAGLLSQATINLIANAIKFTAAGTTIEIFVGRKPGKSLRDHITVAIADHGIGIPEDEMSMLFERFYRASNAVEEHIPGTGLGLAIVAKVVDFHDAKLSIESKLGKGTTFTIEFLEYLSPVEELVAGRKYGLLSEAIASIEEQSPESLKDKLHEYGGALAFYEFPELGEKLLALSRSIPEGFTGENVELMNQRDLLLKDMKAALPSEDEGEIDGQ